MRQIFTAKKLEDAKRQAVQAFGVSESQIVFRILEQKKGLMGIGASVTIEAIYEPPVAAVETPAPAAEPMPEPQAAAPVVEETVETITETVVEPETDAAVEETVSVTETVTVTEPAADAEPEAGPDGPPAAGRGREPLQSHLDRTGRRVHPPALCRAAVAGQPDTGTAGSCKAGTGLCSSRL